MYNSLNLIASQWIAGRAEIAATEFIGLFYLLVNEKKACVHPAEIQLYWFYKRYTICTIKSMQNYFQLLKSGL